MDNYPMYTRTGDTEELISVLRKFSRKIENILEISQSESTISIGNNLVSPLFLDIPLLVLNIEPESSEELLARNIFVANLQELEKQTSIGAHIYCMMIKKMCDEIRLQLVAGSNPQQNPSLDLRKYLRKCRIIEIGSVLKKIVEDDTVLEIFGCASSLAGGEGQLSVDIEDSKFETTIEMSDMFTFAFGMDDNYSKNIRLPHIELSDCRVVIVDGIFEKASEIERFLFYASTNSENIVIVARGFSEEISGILAMNYQRNGVSVFPIVVPFDIYGANAMKDLALVTGNDVISSLKGELISSVRVHEHGIVKKVTLYKEKLLIKEQQNLSVVKKSVRELEKRRANINNNDVRQVLEKRIRSLSPRHVNVKLGKDIMVNYKMVEQRLRRTIMVFNEICQHGIIDSSEILDESTLLQSEMGVLVRLKRRNKSMVPAHSLKRAIIAIRATKYLLMHTGAYVISTN